MIEQHRSKEDYAAPLTEVVEFGTEAVIAASPTYNPPYSGDELDV